MTDLQLVSALMLAVACLATYLAGRLFERDKRLTELQTLLAQVHLEKRAYINQLLVNKGQTPIFGEKGQIIALEHVPDNTSVTQILRPPFAQAEADWEAEEEAEKQSLAAHFGARVPPLSEEDKQRMRQSYQVNVQ